MSAAGHGFREPHAHVQASKEIANCGQNFPEAKQSQPESKPSS